MDDQIQWGKQAKLYNSLKSNMNDELVEESCSQEIWRLNGDNGNSNISKRNDTQFVMKQVANSLQSITH